MTAPATQSNTAAGRRSLPSAFFTPLQTLGLHLDRQRNDRSSAEMPAADPAADPATDLAADLAADRAADLAADRAADLAATRAATRAADRFADRAADPAADLAPDLAPDLAADLAAYTVAQPGVAGRGDVPAGSSAGQQRPHAAFAEVARRVWSEAALVPQTANRPVWQQRGEPEWQHGGEPEWQPGGEPDQAEDLGEGTAFAVAPSPAAPSAVALSAVAPSAVAAPAPVPDRRAGVEEAQALAHDASNLLSALRLYSELLCFSGVLHERHRHYAEDLKLLSQRSERLIDQLVGLAGKVALAGRAEGASRPPAVVETPGHQISGLVPVLMRLRGLLGTIAHGALEMNLGTQAALPVPVPEDALERILVNLVANAAVAIRYGGAIRIRAGVQPEPAPGAPPIVVLTVDDSGCGMTREQIQAALGLDAHGNDARGDVGRPDRGPDSVPDNQGGEGGSGQGRPASAPYRGHGLGLSIVRELVAASGGRLIIHSRPGTGTRIEIQWRAAEAALAAEYNGEQAQAAPLGSVQAAPLRSVQAAPLRSVQESPLRGVQAAPLRGVQAAPLRGVPAAFPAVRSGVSGPGVPAGRALKGAVA